MVMTMIMSILLLSLLFIFGLVNIFFRFRTNKFHAWLKSFFFFTETKTNTSSVQEEKKIRSNRSANKKVELKRVFSTFDKNGDGFITKQELRESLKNLSLLVSETEVEEMVVKVDANGDGLIDFDEFCMLYETMINIGQEDDDHHGAASSSEVRGGGDEEDLKEAFDVFDKDKDGLISVDELGSVLSSLGLNEGRRIENCREMIKKVDTNGDGMVNFAEFRRMMRAGGKLITAF